jgi:hypothetical protein
MKTSKATKDERRARRKDKDRAHHRRGGVTVTPLGGTMDDVLLERLVAAAEHLDLEAPWAEVAEHVLPVLKRLHHPYPPDASPMHMQVPPGIWTGFGIDFGPAFTHVTAGQVERWGVDRATLLATALDNLRALVVVEPPRIERITPQGIDTLAIQGQGWGSSLVLLPEVLAPIVGPAPRLLLAPVRNTLIALPETADLDFVELLWGAVADGAHDELDVAPLRWTGSTVAALGDGAIGLPN